MEPTVVADHAYRLRVFHRIGLLRPQSPVRLLRAGYALLKWGTSVPTAVTVAAARCPKQLAIVDDAGELTWAELNAQIHRFAHALQSRGIAVGDPVAVLARNHRYLVIAIAATMQLGGRVLLLNTMASGPQLAELARREGAKLVIFDAEFRGVAAASGLDDLVLAWSDEAEPDLPTVESECAGQPTSMTAKPSHPGSIVIFTSGTTGLPKGAKRREPEGLDPLVSFFGAIPYRSNATVVVAAPLFHSWGLINFSFGLSTIPTYVLRRRFDPVEVLRDIEQYRADALVVVPLMMQRMVDVDPGLIEQFDVSSLRITATSGAALAGELATRYMDLFTDSVYNFYGATETGWVTTADPEDLRAAPGTAGRPPWHTTVKVLDAEGRPVPRGQTGVIYVGSDMQFGGYTDGNTKVFADGLMSTGDLGHFDAEGRLFVSGRDDDMIISGGENVFPGELEDALIDHPQVADVVVCGIPDEKWGQRLAAYVVPRPGAALDYDTLAEYAKDKVSRFAVPAKIKFLSELPRNPTGKVMKRELPGFD
jgi:fatty-acyl-CoA synthase